MATLVNRSRLSALLGIILVAALCGGVGLVIARTWFRPNTVTAYFATTTSIYPGDEVRVLGVKVGTIRAMEPDGASVKLTMELDRSVRVPADARAVIVAPNLVAARYVQLAPAYGSSGPVLPDGAVIPQERTAVPVEWDQVKTQLTRLATELGPQGNGATPSMARFIDSAANAVDGNGAKLRQTLTQLSGVSRTLAEGSGDIVATIQGLQTFVTALRDSKQQIVEFQGRLAKLSSVLDGSRGDLDGAIRNLSEAVGEVQRFISGTRDGTAEQVERLANVTQNLVDHRMDLEQVLHVSPTALVNTYNMFDPRTGAAAGEFLVNNLSNMTGLVCGMIGALENVTADDTGKLCAQYLGPGLNRVSLNYLPIPFNPFQLAVPPWQDLIYSEARLRPDAEGPPPPSPEMPPAISAYTGLPGDTPAADWPPLPGAPPAPAPSDPRAAEPPPAPLPAEAPQP
jgi:virulence factor Mce-like protein